jgi:hypothetical protein
MTEDDEIKRIFSEISDQSRDALSMLFPRAATAFGRDWLADRSTPSKDRRIQSQSSAYSYFELTRPKFDWSIELLQRAATDRFFIEDMLENEIDSITDENEERSRLINELLDYIEESNIPNLINAGIISSIISKTSLFIKNDDDISFSSTRAHIEDIIVHCYSEYENKIEAARAIAELIDGAPDVTILCGVVRRLFGDIREEGSSQKRDTTRTAEFVRQKLVEKIQKLADTGDIFQSAKPNIVFWCWWAQTDDNQVKDYLSTLMHNGQNTEDIMKMAVNIGLSSSNGYFDYVQTEWNRILDLDDLDRKANKIVENKSGSVDIADRYLAARKRRQ